MCASAVLETQAFVKAESSDVLECEQSMKLPPVPLYMTYASVQEITYTPETALQQGLAMVKAIKKEVLPLELGSRMRKEVWLREVADLEVQGFQGAPTTLIAVCGATGVGKSSLINAILDDNIVPTSGMRACTAVVTEIAYHVKPTIDADISFLTMDEWKEELEVLLDDLVDDNGCVRRSNELRSDAGIAWLKVNAVYPSLAQDQLARMSADEIMQYDRTIIRRLGTTEHICSKDSKAFSLEISKYIDSRDRKRNHKRKDRKNKQKDKKDDKNGNGESKQENKQGDKKEDKKEHEMRAAGSNLVAKELNYNEPSLWPLIRQVAVKCNATALSTGSVIVDLPGVTDANTARSNICKNYMKKCACVWILAPITRAVDDRTAKDLLGDAFKIQLKMDGNYDDSAVTFIATKTDDISCSEVIRALKLQSDEKIKAINKRIHVAKKDQRNWKNRNKAASVAIKAIEKELKDICAFRIEYLDHLHALQTGQSFHSQLTAKGSRGGCKTTLGKRKRAAAKSKKAHRRKLSNSPEDIGSNDIDTDGGEDGLEISESASENNDSNFDRNSSSESESDSGEVGEEQNDVIESEEEITEQYLQAKVHETDNTIELLRARLSSKKLKKQEIIDEMINTKSKLAKAQTEKNGICSLRRSEYSRNVLEEDFRVGLREIDETEDQERDPASFDPTQQQRNYEGIHLRTFCISSRDYMRITRQAKGDGNPMCFTNVEDTGIPDLQKWCRDLTVLSGQRVAMSFLTRLQTFIVSALSYVEGITETTEEDRLALRTLWQSPTSEVEEKQASEGEQTDNYDKDAKKERQTVTGRFDPEKPVGIMNRLIKDLAGVADNAMDDLKSRFESNLKDRLQVGALKAAASAVEISDQFTQSMHWAKYRATLRRDGTYSRCLNTELTSPLTKSIVSSWARVFEADLFSSVEKRAMSIIEQTLKEVENSAARCLKDRSSQQGEIAVRDVKVAMKSLVDSVRKVLNDDQKEISRCLVPLVQKQLHSGYQLAFLERGPGSVARQKAVFHSFITNARNSIFNQGADVLRERLDKAAESIGGTLTTTFEGIAQKVEVNMSVLWENPNDDPRETSARREVLTALNDMSKQVTLWRMAGEAN